MALGDLFQAAAGDVSIETSFSPPVHVDLTGSGSSSGLSKVLMPILRPKVRVAGVTYAPYGDPLPLWPIALAIVVLLVVKKYT